MITCACGKHDMVTKADLAGQAAYRELGLARRVHHLKRCGSLKDDDFRAWFLTWKWSLRSRSSPSPSRGER